MPKIRIYIDIPLFRIHTDESMYHHLNEGSRNNIISTIAWKMKSELEPASITHIQMELAYIKWEWMICFYVREWQMNMFRTQRRSNHQKEGDCYEISWMWEESATIKIDITTSKQHEMQIRFLKVLVQTEDETPKLKTDKLHCEREKTKSKKKRSKRRRTKNRAVR